MFGGEGNSKILHRSVLDENTEKWIFRRAAKAYYHFSAQSRNIKFNEFFSYFTKHDARYHTDFFSEKLCFLCMVPSRQQQSSRMKVTWKGIITMDCTKVLLTFFTIPSCLFSASWQWSKTSLEQKFSIRSRHQSYLSFTFLSREILFFQNWDLIDFFVEKENSR